MRPVRRASAGVFRRATGHDPPENPDISDISGSYRPGKPLPQEGDMGSRIIRYVRIHRTSPALLILRMATRVMKYQIFQDPQERMQPS